MTDEGFGADEGQRAAGSPGLGQNGHLLKPLGLVSEQFRSLP